MNFGLIGAGSIARKHREAISACGGRIIKIHDPKYEPVFPLDDSFFEMLDYTVICSPSYLHREHTELSLKHDIPVIVEKPASMPWEPMINDNRVNVVLQLRWLDLPKSADLINIRMVRDSDYYKGWVGNPIKTGGIFYHLFIHYIDLAIRLRAQFVGHVAPEGNQHRFVDDINLEDKINTSDLYIKMYNDIVNYDEGVKPKDLFFLDWVLDKSGWDYGFNKRYTLEHGIRFDFRDLGGRK